METTQSKFGRRFDEEFKREVAALASELGAKQEQVARDLGVSAFSCGPLVSCRQARRSAFIIDKKSVINNKQEGCRK